MKKYMRRAMCIMMAAVLSIGSMVSDVSAFEVGGRIEAGSNSDGTDDIEDNSGTGVEEKGNGEKEVAEDTDSKKEEDKGTEVNFTSNEGWIDVTANNKAQAKKKGKAKVQKLLDECKVDRSLYTIKCVGILKRSCDYLYQYKLRWKYNTSDDNFKKYRRNCRDVMEDICDHDGENSYYAKKYKSKRKKVNKDKFIQLTVKYFDGIGGMPARRLARSLEGKSLACRQKAVREASLTDYDTIFNGAIGNGLVGVYGDMSFHELCSANNMPVSLNSHITGVVPLTKVMVLYDYPNGWSLVKFYSNKNFYNNHTLSVDGTYFVRTQNLADTKKKATPEYYGWYDPKDSFNDKEMRLLTGHPAKYFKAVRNNLTARDKWVIRMRSAYMQSMATDELLDYYYKHYDGAIKQLRSESCLISAINGTLVSENILTKINGEYRNIEYWTSESHLRPVRDYIFSHSKDKSTELYNMAWD